MERLTNTQIYYVVFDKCHGKEWWDWFLHPRFQHVRMYTASGGGHNHSGHIAINPLAHTLSIADNAISVTDMISHEIEQGCTAVLQFTVHYGACYKYAHVEPLTCVSLAKRVLCIRRRWLLTPKALYHELIKAGAVVIKPYTIVVDR